MILICEPVCVKHEHGEVNFALIELLKKTYDDSIIFIGDSSHISFIRSISSIKSVHFLEKCVPLNEGNLFKRLLNQFFYFFKIFSIASNQKVDKLYFSAITIPGIINVKLFAFLFPSIKVYIIGHAIFEKLKFSTSSSNYNTSIHNVVYYFHPKNLNYIFYGLNNHNKLHLNYPHLINYLSSFDLPYLFKEIDVHRQFYNGVFIGALGIARIDKGSDLFFNVAKNVINNISVSKVKFIQIGKVVDLPYQTYLNYINFPSPENAISYKQYLEYISKIHYSIYLYNCESYKISVSASFYDSLSFGIPVIAFKGGFFDSYFSRFGDIGYLLKDENEMVDLICSLNNGFDKERYFNQVKNIKLAQKELSLDGVSSYIKETLNK